MTGANTPAATPRIIAQTTGIPTPTSHNPPGITAQSIPAQLFKRIEIDPQATAYLVPADQAVSVIGPEKTPTTATQRFAPVTWEEFGQQVIQLAAGLKDLGIGHNDIVALLANTQFDWMTADLATQATGAATAAIYPTSTATDIEWILRDSGARILILDDATALDTLRPMLSVLPALEHIIVIGQQSEDFQPDAATAPPTHTLSDILDRGAAAHSADPDAIPTAIAALTSEDLASLVYTSGTTGAPKGVKLTHGNWLAESESIEQLDLLGPTDMQMLWLPLSHVFARTFAYAQYRLGYASGIDGRVPELVDNLSAVHPTFMPAVPRIFEKIHTAVTAQAKGNGRIKWAGFRWSVSVGTKYVRAQGEGRKPSAWLRAQYKLADRLVFNRVRERLGGKMRHFVSGSAPLSIELLEFFHMCGPTILEGYGLTETSAAVTVNRPHDYLYGTTGPALPGQTIAIAEDGEVLVGTSGGVVTVGYHDDDAATNDIIIDGWFHTGDIGELVDGRYLKITDRKRDMFKTSGGKYVAPARIEAQLGASSPLIGQAVLHGADESYCVALISVDGEELEKWAGARSISGTYAELVRHPELEAELQAVIDETNPLLPRWEQIRKFAVLPREMSIDAAEITASLKVRRKAVVERYQQIIQGLYVRDRQ